MEYGGVKFSLHTYFRMSGQSIRRLFQVFVLPSRSYSESTVSAVGQTLAGQLISDV